MNHSEIRDIFFSFFIKKKHYKVLSSPLIPAKDPTILFANAGMNQFKDVFLGRDRREYKRAVSIQKCMRVSGKHNDFDEVGKSEYHHTFFEMLGNFSFGDYFKEGAIEFAWELLTQHYKFNPEKLWISVFKDDEDAFRIWEQKIGVPPQKIICSDEKDNFWQMGETGPCGPCSEIYFDKGESHGPANLTDNARRFVEIWNLVFMQYNKDQEGKLQPLTAPSIDTGMGMERLTSLIQEVDSNYQTDLFKTIIDFTAELCSPDPNKKQNQIDLKVIADHVRALSFLISDGVLPANDGRGYVLRRLLRRASKHGKSLGFTEPFLSKISGKAVEVMRDVYPELEYNRDFISQVILAEEERFNHTLANGLKRFEDILIKAQETEQKTIPGKDLFTLSDTYGFPLDFAIDLAAEKNISIDHRGFQKELENQREKSRRDLSKKKKTSQHFINIEKFKTEFTGYHNMIDESSLLAIYAPTTVAHHYQKIPQVSSGPEQPFIQDLILVFDKTPFYPESGGQTGDSGTGKNENVFLEISDTQRHPGGAILHMTRLRKGTLKPGDRLMLSVNQKKRQDTAIHHSATHLLHYALREVLGLHVKQAGSYVGPDKLRFDFTHFKPLTQSEQKKIEGIVNMKIRENSPTHSEHMKYESAIEEGAIALFQEKYSDQVRVISMGDFSKELCGGIHVQQSGEIGLFKILSESSISSGIRRIEAIGGGTAFLHIQKNSDILNKIQHLFGQKQNTIYEFLLKMDQTLKEKEKQIRKAEEGNKKMNFLKIIGQGASINDVPTVVEYVNDSNLNQLRTLADEIKNKNKGITILLSNINGKSAIIVSVFKKLTQKLDARAIAKEIARLVDGNGGGRPDFAQAGGKPIQNINHIKNDISAILKKYLT
jgi:alanyl-tRNA synthetase